VRTVDRVQDHLRIVRCLKTVRQLHSSAAFRSKEETMTRQPSGAPTLARRSFRFAPLCLAALVVSIGLPATAPAQLNQTLHQDGWILAASHAPGLQGSIWRTDLWVHARTYGTGSATLTFCEAGENGTDAQEYALEFGDGENIVYVEDVVDHFLHVGGGSWLGAIHYVSDLPVQVYARVYSISPDGSRSYGQVIEGIPTADMSMAYNDPGYPGTEEDQWMFAMKHTADGRYRVNIGMVNPTAVATPFFVSIFDATGNYPPGGGDPSVEVQMPPFSMRQLSDPFADISGGEWSNYIVRVEAGAAGSAAFGYASVVDNATNDAFFVRGTKQMTPAE
jgi:hypothetical protein